MLTALLLLAGGLGLLTVAADVLVRGATNLALHFGVSPLVVGLTVVAFGTSAPELVASVVASLQGSTDMALGNVVGSNISNIALVLGVAAVINPIQVERQITRRDAPLALGASVLLVLFLLDGVLVRWEGVVLFAGILGYVAWSIQATRVGISSKAVAEEVDLEEAEKPIWKGYVYVLVGLIGLALGASWFVDGAKHIARLFGISEAVIGLTVMAVGTSLPEIATVVAASLRGMSDLVTGNAIGSNIFNILCVLGISAMIVPLSLGGITYLDLGVFIGSAILIWVMMMYPRHLLTRWDGILLILGYVVYVVYLF